MCFISMSLCLSICPSVRFYIFIFTRVESENSSFYVALQLSIIVFKAMYCVCCLVLLPICVSHFHLNRMLI